MLPGRTPPPPARPAPSAGREGTGSGPLLRPAELAAQKLTEVLLSRATMQAGLSKSGPSDPAQPQRSLTPALGPSRAPSPCRLTAPACDPASTLRARTPRSAHTGGTDEDAFSDYYVQPYKLVVNNMDQDVPKPAAASAAENDQRSERAAGLLMRAFLKANGRFLRNISWRKSPRTEGYIDESRSKGNGAGLNRDIYDDLAQDVSLEFYLECMKDPQFLAEMSNTSPAEMLKHPYIKTWIKDVLAAQHRKAFRLLPRATAQADELFLRIAAIRPDGRLFPLVRENRTKREESYLKVLLKPKISKLEEVGAWPGDVAWDPVPTGRDRTLRLTEGRKGAGRETLQRLEAAGFLVLAPCDGTQALVWCRDEFQKPWTLVISDAGRHYLSQVDNNGLTDSIDDTDPDDGDGDGTGVEVASDGHDAEEQLDAEFYRDLASRLMMKLAEMRVDPTLTGTKLKAFNKVYAYALRVPFLKKKDRPLILEQVSKLVDVSVSTLSRWDNEGRDEEHLAALRKILNEMSRAEDDRHFV